MEWNIVKNSFLNSRNSVEIFERENVTEKNNTVMEAIVNNTDSVVINKYLRILGSGQSLYENIFSFNLEAERAFGKKIILWRMMPSEGCSLQEKRFIISPLIPWNGKIWI